jgi:hypothetical protein
VVLVVVVATFCFVDIALFGVWCLVFGVWCLVLFSTKMLLMMVMMVCASRINQFSAIYQIYMAPLTRNT